MSRLAVDTKALRSMPLDGLFAFAEMLASTHHDGHLVVYRLTTSWKVLFTMPCNVTHEQLDDIVPSKTLRAALERAITAQLGESK